MKKISMAIALAALFTASIANADGFLRIKCFDDNEGADVFINGKEVGTCPVDAPTPAGMVTVRARKLVGNGYEKVFVKEVRVIDNVPLKMEISLSSNPQLTAEAILSRAESGDIDAMYKIAQYYDSGYAYGVEKSAEQAQLWRDKAAETTKQQEIATTQSLLTAAKSGDIEAMKSLVERYEQGVGTSRNPAAVQEWRNMIEIEITRTMQRDAEDWNNPGAMDSLADRYEKGIGTTPDLNQAKAWRERAIKSRRQLTLQSKRDNAQQVVDQKERELNNIDWFPLTKKSWKAVKDGKVDDYREWPIISRGTTLTYMPFMFIADLALCVPFQGSTYYQKKSELDDAKQRLQRISAWGNPDSLIARAATKSGDQL